MPSTVLLRAIRPAGIPVVLAALAVVLAGVTVLSPPPCCVTEVASAQGPTYPESRGLNDDAIFISRLRFGNQRLGSGNADNGYEDRTSQTIVVYSGTTEYVSFHPTHSGKSELPAYWLVWFDLNSDGDFDDTVNGYRELLVANPNYSTGSTVKGMFQRYIKVPDGFDGTTTRMRVSLAHKSSEDTPAPGSDEIFAYGEVEDYTVAFRSPPIAPVTPPGDVAVKEAEPTYAMLEWSAVQGARSYFVQYRDLRHRRWITVDTFFHSPDSTRTALALVTLEADTPYEVRVGAANPGGVSDYGTPVGFRTAPAIAPAGIFPTVGLHSEGVPFPIEVETEWRMWDPFVLYDDEAGLYKVWYTVWGGHEYDFYRNRQMGVGYAWSHDGVNWRRQPGGHVLLPTADSWDRDGLETVSVVKKDGRYYMWYLGKNNSPYLHQLGLATSRDGVHWVKNTGGPVLSPEQPFEGACVKEPSVIWDEREQVFKMWYNGMADGVVKVGYATSPDGVSWAKTQGPVNGGESAGWNHVHVVRAPGGGYQMYFLVAYSVYQAWSPDGIHDWALNPNGPVLRARAVGNTWNGAKHDFERLLAYGSPSAVFRDGELKLYHMRSWSYATEYGDNSMRFGLATGTAGDAVRVFVPIAASGIVH